MPKTWSEKFLTRTEPEVIVLDKKFADVQAGESMVITTPKIIEDYMRTIPKGQESSVAEFRVWAAKKYKADKACPVTSGMFARIVAEKQIEEMDAGKVAEKDIAPFWRMIGPKSPILKKLSFDLGIWKKHREAEGLPV